MDGEVGPGLVWDWKTRDWQRVDAGAVGAGQPVGLVLASGWHRIGTELIGIDACITSDWQLVVTGFASDWDGWVMDWHKIGITLTLDCRWMTETVGGLGLGPGLMLDRPWIGITFARD